MVNIPHMEKNRFGPVLPPIEAKLQAVPIWRGNEGER